MSAKNWGNKEVGKFIRKYAKRGWRAEHTRNNHVVIYHDETGAGPVFLPVTPSSRRWMRHAEAEIARQLRDAESSA